MSTVTISGIIYTLNAVNNTASVTGYNNTISENSTIQNTVSNNNVDYSVTSISSSAFQSCTSLTSIIIPDSVTSIGVNAFQSCTSLTSIIIPDLVTFIGFYAFNQCNQLINVQINNPNNVSNLGSNIFTNVSSNSLSEITYYNTNTLPTDWNTVNSNFANVVIYSQGPCFNEGTKILSLNREGKDEYIEIEKLQKGDLVKTYKHGYRRIKMIGKSKMANDSSNIYCMHKMEMNEKNKKKGLLEELIITGNHSILVSDLGIHKEENLKLLKSNKMIDDKYLLLSCLSNDFVKIQDKEIYTYYHFVLEDNKNKNEQFGVWANGILTETMSVNKFIEKFNNNEM
jgi:hypothetical protein